ncbi:MAG: fasciclin domain-containing protein [Planctomycetes bacterium]|nr:fasciclin domain-containing protein [Planctomycetota bacterium]
MKLSLKLLTVLAAVMLTATAGTAEEKTAKSDIVDTAVGAKGFSTLVAAVKAADLVDTLKGDGPFTVFAPNDDAFAKLPKGTLEMLLKPENKSKLASILTFHVVSGKVMSKDVLKLTEAQTVFGQKVSIDTTDGVKVNGAKVIKADIECSNGVIHVIDTVILPKDIVGVAAANDDFSTLVAAVKAAGLVETLQGEGPFTVFAPNNAAFDKLPEGTVTELLKPENKEKLAGILKFHVVSGSVMAADVVKLTEATTVQGQNVSIEVKDKAVYVNGSKVIATDIKCSNGVIHVLESVILPK